MPWVAAAWCLDLEDFATHRREIAGRRRPGDHPREIEHPDTRQRQLAGPHLLARPASEAGDLASSRSDALRPPPGGQCDERSRDASTKLAGGVAVGLFFVIQNLVSRGSIGLGDAKLGGLVGAICGISLDYNHIGAVYAVIYAIFLGGGVALLLLILRLRSLKDPIPYVPFLCAGAAIILFQGP